MLHLAQSRFARNISHNLGESIVITKRSWHHNNGAEYVLYVNNIATKNCVVNRSETPSHVVLALFARYLKYGV